MRTALHVVLLGLVATHACASKIELSTVPPREGVEVIIYRDVDLTLVREQRGIRFHKGPNEVAFSWADTNIDPTSVRIRIAGDGAGYELTETTYPPEQPNTLVWHIEAPKDGAAPLEVSYFTRGLTWSASYTLVLNREETEGTLSADFSIGNQSGEDYEDARVALLTGGVRLVEQVVALDMAEGESMDAYRDHAAKGDAGPAGPAGGMMGGFGGGGGGFGSVGRAAVPMEEVEIAAATVSEHERYNLDTELTLSNGWVTRLRFTETDKAAPKVLARVTVPQETTATRIVKVKNDKEHGLGGSALPAGPITLFKRDTSGRLVYLGESQMPYAGVGQEVEFPAGSLLDVVVKTEYLAMRKRDFRFAESNDALVGKVTEQDWRIETRNRDTIARTLEIIQPRPGEPNVLVAQTKPTKRDAGRITWEYALEPNGAGVLAHSFHCYWGTSVNDMPKESE